MLILEVVVVLVDFQDKVYSINYQLIILLRVVI